MSDKVSVSHFLLISFIRIIKSCEVRSIHYLTYGKLFSWLTISQIIDLIISLTYHKSKQLMLLKCGAGEDSWEITVQQGDKPVNPKGYQPWIFIGRTDAEAEVPISSHLMQRADSLEKILMLEKIEGKRRREHQGMGWWDNITDSTDMSLSKFWEIVKDGEAWHAAVHEVTKSWTQLNSWTTTSHFLTTKIPVFTRVKLLITECYRPYMVDQVGHCTRTPSQVGWCELKSNPGSAYQSMHPGLDWNSIIF